LNHFTVPVAIFSSPKHLGFHSARRSRGFKSNLTTMSLEEAP
jgi:hypothetical protein